MRKTTTIRIHGLAGCLSLLLITMFFTARIIVNLIGDHGALVEVKKLTLIGVCVLIPAMAITGATGHLGARGRGDRVIRVKRLRLAIAAAIGLAVLVPCAVIIQRLSASGDSGTTLHVLQAVELAGGAACIALLSANVRAGLIMTGRIHKHRPARPGPGAAVAVSSVPGRDRVAEGQDPRHGA